MACRESYIREYESVDECYYVCPACHHGRYIMGMVIHDKIEDYTYFKPYTGEDICHECGEEMERKITPPKTA